MKQEATSGGIGLSTVLTIIFLILKLTGAITWPWLWVLSPLWIPFVAVLVFMLLFFIVFLIIGVIGAIWG